MTGIKFYSERFSGEVYVTQDHGDVIVANMRMCG